jgi:hypothetical protein
MDTLYRYNDNFCVSKVPPQVTKAPAIPSTTKTSLPENKPRFPAPTHEEGCALGHDPIQKHWDPAEGYRFGRCFFFFCIIHYSNHRL